MTLKEIVINKFLKDDTYNFTAYNTNFEELSRMYDLIIEYSKLPQKNWFTRLLIEQKAITLEGFIRYDRETSFVDEKTKQIIPIKVNFRYPVFSFLKSRWEDAIIDIKEKESKIPLPVV